MKKECEKRRKEKSHLQKKGEKKRVTEKTSLSFSEFLTRKGARKGNRFVKGLGNLLRS